MDLARTISGQFLFLFIFASNEKLIRHLVSDAAIQKPLSHEGQSATPGQLHNHTKAGMDQGINISLSFCYSILPSNKLPTTIITSSINIIMVKDADIQIVIIVFICK